MAHSLSATQSEHGVPQSGSSAFTSPSGFSIASVDGDEDLFVLPEPALPVAEEDFVDIGDPLAYEKEILDSTASSAANAWCLEAILPQLRVRAQSGHGSSGGSSCSTPSLTPKLSPKLGPQVDPSPKSNVRRRMSQQASPSTPATRAQLREVATGAEDVLNRLRYDLLSTDGFCARLDNVERPPSCRPFLLRGVCENGTTCRHNHIPSLTWWAMDLPPASAGGGGHVPYTEAMLLAELFALLDAAPSQMARYALLQTVSFVLYRNEVVWSRDIGRTAALQLWERFVGAFRSGACALSATCHLRGDVVATTPSDDDCSAEGRCRRAGELLQALPGAIWERVMHALGDPLVVARAGWAFLASSGMRSGALAEDVLWDAMIRAAWGPSWGRGGSLRGHQANQATPGWESQELRSWCRYAVLASDMRTARLLWAVCGHAALSAAGGGGLPLPLASHRGAALAWSEHEGLAFPSRSSFATTRVPMENEVTIIRAGSSLTAAASRDASEIRLFSTSSFNRLPPLRLKCRGVDAFDLAPEHDAMVVAATDGNISVHSISDAGGASIRIGRVDNGGSPSLSRQALLAGLHFTRGSGGGQFVAAVRGSHSAQLFDVATATLVTQCNKVQSPHVETQGILSCEPLGFMSSTLLVGSSGAVRLWDARSPDLISLADLSFRGSACTAVDVASRAVAVVSSAPASVVWIDLRSGRCSEARPELLWPQVFRAAAVQESPVRVALARRGFLAAWFDAPAAPVACYLGGGPSLAPLRAGPAAGTVTAMAKAFGGDSAQAPLVIALARPSRRKILFEVCSAGAMSLADFELEEQATLTAAEPRTDRKAAGPPRRKPGRDGPGRGSFQGRSWRR